MAVGVIVSVFAATTVGAKVAHQAEASSQVMSLIEKELEQGNANLTAGGNWDYGELPAVVPVSRQDLNRYRLEIERQGLESYAGGGDVVSYGILLCSRPVGADEESCSRTSFRAPPPAAATGGGVTTDTSAQLYIGGEDPTGAAHVVATDGAASQTFTSYGTYTLPAGYTVTASDVVNTSGIRYSPELASGGGAVQVYYRASSGAIVINVSKEEPGLTLPALTLSGPSGFSANVPEGESRYSEAPAGGYRLEAPSVSYGGYDYAARFGSSAAADGSFQVALGAIKRVDAHYVPTNGKLQLEFKGGGPAPRIVLKKKVGNDYERVDGFVLSASKSYERMDPATYSVSLDGSYLGGGVRYALEYRRYDPARGAWTAWFKDDEVRFDLIPGKQTLVWMRAYPVTGKVTLNIDAPAGTTFNVTLAGPTLDGLLYSRTFTRPGTYTLDDLAPGSYSLEASSGKDGSGNYYRVSGPESFTLSSGQSKSVSLEYERQSGGTLIYFNLLTGGRPRWANEPTAYKTAIVDPGTSIIAPDQWTVHRSFRPLWIPPGKEGRICTADPIPGEFITYEVDSFIAPGIDQWTDCLSFRGSNGDPQVRRASASIRPVTGYLSTQVNLVRESAPTNDFFARFRIVQDDNGGTYVIVPAEVKGNELTRDPNASQHWVGTAAEQVAFVGAITSAAGVALYRNKQCDVWSLDIKLFDPDGVAVSNSGTFSREEYVSLPVSNLTLLGRKAYLDVYVVCP